MGIAQYTVGKSWEEEVLEYYSSHGYSTLKLPTDLEGTVFDIIAIKNNHAICIECKHTSTDKLYYKSSGLQRKRDELDNFYNNGNNVIIFVKSDKTGTFLIDWKVAKKIFKDKGYIKKEDCIPWEVK